jgi:hypothetical protein
MRARVSHTPTHAFVFAQGSWSQFRAGPTGTWKRPFGLLATRPTSGGCWGTPGGIIASPKIVLLPSKFSFLYIYPMTWHGGQAGLDSLSFPCCLQPCLLKVCPAIFISRPKCLAGGLQGATHLPVDHH